MMRDEFVSYLGIEKQGCLESVNDKVFGIFDPSENGNPCQKVDADSENAHLFVENKTSESISFLKIDSCLYPAFTEPQRCDCAIFNTNEFYFVELKDRKAKGRNAAKDEAIKQLESTIVEFNKRISFSNIDVIALICFKFKQKFPMTDCQKASEKSRFETAYKVSLKEGNKIIFE